MNSMKCEKKHLSTDEICRIIATCKKNCVSSCNIEGIELSFFDKVSKSYTDVKKIYNSEKVDTEDELKKNISEEINQKEEQLAEMLINDPVQYEKLIEQGEIVDARDEYSEIE